VAPTTSTRPRVPLRVLVRAPGVGPRELTKRFTGYSVAILGPANKEDWEGLWRDGDLEGFAWVSESLQVNDAIADLRTFPEIIDARISARDVFKPK
jgi:hypothetical protein